jgi:hypothetical protein
MHHVVLPGARTRAGREYLRLARARARGRARDASRSTNSIKAVTSNGLAMCALNPAAKATLVSRRAEPGGCYGRHVAKVSPPGWGREARSRSSWASQCRATPHPAFTREEGSGPRARSSPSHRRVLGANDDFEEFQIVWVVVRNEHRDSVALRGHGRSVSRAINAV